MDEICKNIFIEFLAAGTDPTKNAVILKIDFQNRPRGFDAMRLSMDMDPDCSGFTNDGAGLLRTHKPGRLSLKPVRSKAGSASHVRSVQMPLRPNLKLDQILHVINQHHLHLFSFTSVGGRDAGSRDFMHVEALKPPYSINSRLD